MPQSPAQRRYRFLFISSNTTSWGGSEELWAAGAAALAEEGHEVSVLKESIDETRPAIRRLRELGCRVRDYRKIPFVPRRLFAAVSSLSQIVGAANRLIRTVVAVAFSRADLVIISQGGNLDGLPLANLCLRLKKPYVLIAQKAGDMYWPMDARVDRMRAVYTRALHSFFVSEHNRRLTEEQLGHDLPASTVVRNPFLVSWERRTDWPDASQGFRFACIGRLYAAEKGQDLLIRVLARDRWRKRPISVTFVGNGPNRDGLAAMAAYHGLSNVSFAGFTDDMAAVWNDHHGLILPSRCEGLPLVLVEAMLSGRVPIVTNVAGNSEVVRDGETGFLAAFPSEDALDAAMEHAWQRRNELRSIGNAAADAIRTLVPEHPGQALAERLLGVLCGSVCDAEVPAALADVA